MFDWLWIVRTLVGVAPAILLFEAFPAVAQTVLDPSEVPACQTTAGDDGLMFLAQFGLVYAPVTFAQVTSDAGKLTVLPDVRHGQGVLAYGGPPGLGFAQSAETPPAPALETVVEFSDADGKIVHQCRVGIVAFDPAMHDLTQLQSGDCNLRLLAGRPQLLAGHNQVWETPQRFDELSVGIPGVADLSGLSPRIIYLLGRSPGLTVLVWTTDPADGEAAVNICPVPVVDAGSILGPDGPPDERLCEDETGVVIRLSVGETAMVALRDRDGAALAVASGAIAEDRIADIRFGEGGTSLTVWGVAPGSTSISLFDMADNVLHHCEIVVE